MTSAKIVNKVAQNLQKSILSEQIQSMLKHFETYNFLQVNENNNLEFDVHGQNLKEIIRTEWLFKNMTLSEIPAFCTKQIQTEYYLKSIFQQVKNIVSDLPFSLIEIYDKPVMQKPKHLKSNIVDLVKNKFQVHSGTILKSQTLCPPQIAHEVFYKQQQEHKIWWRKFAAMPGRFYTTEISSDENSKSVEIRAEFPWGSEIVEIIKYLPEKLLFDTSTFEIKSNKKKCVPHVITSETSLDTITMTYLCDSYEISNEETISKVLRFARKLAPYKVAFSAPINLTNNLDHLKELATLLAKQIRKCGIPVLLLPDLGFTSLERQILRNDAIGVPFTIIFNEKSLRDGIISLRSRDTTLKEQSHVSLIVPYVEKLMKNG